MKKTQFQHTSARSVKPTSRRTYLLVVTLLTVFVVSPLFLPNAFAQNYAHWGLPKGVKARLGKGYVGDLQFSADGNRLMVENSVGIWVYDAHSGVELDLITGNVSDSFALSPDGSIAAGWSQDDQVILWHTSDSKNRVFLKGDTSKVDRIAFSPDGQTVAGGTFTYEVLLWNVDTGARTATLLGHTHAVTSVDFSPDGRTLASGSWDKTIRLWDVSTNAHQATLTEHTEGVSHVAFSPDGETFVSSSYNEDKVILWDTVTWEQKAAFNIDINCFAVSPDSSTLATGSRRGELHLWDVATGTHKMKLMGHLSRIGSVTFSPDGKTLASAGDGKLYLWDIASGARKLEITGHTSSVFTITFSPDGRTLASGGYEKILLWDTGTAKYEATLFVGDWASNASLAFSPDGGTLASEAGSLIHLWDVSNRAHNATIDRYGLGGGGLTRYASIVFSPDGKFLASSGSSNRSVHLWYAGRTYKTALTGHKGKVTSVAFSPDSRTIASGSEDNTIILWDVATDTAKATFIGHTDTILDVAFSPDMSLLASSSKDNMIILWDVATGEPKTTLVAQTTRGVSDIAFSPDSQMLASCGDWDDVPVQLWDVATGELKTTFVGHTSGVNDIAFSPDGQTLASSNGDGTILLWDLAPETAAEPHPTHLVEDVNRDGIVNIQDLVFVAGQFGQAGTENAADINGDGVVNIIDIVLVAGALEVGNGAPSAYSKALELLTIEEVEQWLARTHQIDGITPAFQRGIAVLESLVVLLTPKETVLLPNYPNPFNPETWIPYQLSETTDVTIRIYTAGGTLVRTLALGNQPAGIYHSRSRSAYWDGKNELGEPVASGVYFYTLSAGRFTATRRMVIRK